jgi:Xaa-Pro aminopeptidase
LDLAMFDTNVYTSRRGAVRQKLTKGIVLLIGSVESPIRAAQNTYPFRQDSTFLYFVGINRPRLAAVIDLDSGEDTIFGDEKSLDDEIWMGESPTLASLGIASGCKRTRPYADLSDVVRLAVAQQRPLHFLPTYRSDSSAELARLLDYTGSPERRASMDLIETTVGLREIKEAGEIDEIEKALRITDEMHRVAMRATRPGSKEKDIVAEMRRVLGYHGVYEAYQPIFSREGQILHNHSHGLTLEAGDLVVNDWGASSSLGYASDITRTIPVGGRFSEDQKEIYQLLLRAQMNSIAQLQPGVPYKDVHELAALTIVEGMKDLGFFKGNARDVVSSGAYAICFPHGLGHQLGLDVHDMESYGEDHVGYDSECRRSELFGLKNLRMARRLKAGMVLTVEPGIYFIPTLIDRWREEQRHASFINYARFDEYSSFGGIRVEDNLLITADSARILGPGIPKEIGDLEEIIGS